MINEESLHTGEIVEEPLIGHSATAHHEIALEVITASKNWIKNFNEGNIQTCMSTYDPNATLSMTPFGIKCGVKDISKFWMPFVASGATNLVYTDVSVEVVDQNTAFLSASWSMNVGRGLIFQEKWERIENKWVLTYDNFDLLEQFEHPRENTIHPVASHLVLESIIKSSIVWINNFNAGEGDACGDGYSETAFMNATPFVKIGGKNEITSFWNKLIKDGAKELIYSNPTFRACTENTGVLSSNWRMNIGEGKIYKEKWNKMDDEWLITYDEFQVLKQH